LSRRLSSLTAVVAALLLLTSCTPTESRRHADVIIVGAGIAGISAALEASAHGARVLVIEANSVGGGHAVKAGGFALVDTALQREKNIADSPDLAYRDLARWGEDPDPFWARYYVENSATEVYDWLTGHGIEFRVILPTPDSSVPRFHFTRGTAANVVVPLLRKAMVDPNIEFIWNTRVTALSRVTNRINGVYTVNERDGSRNHWLAGATVLATGGFQNNLAMVRANWPEATPAPEQIFSGAGQFATGDGYRLAEWAGADMRNMDHQVTFYGGAPDPRAPGSGDALYTENPAAIWLAADGRRFINEEADDKAVAAAAEQIPAGSYWMIFDSRGSRRLAIRDALLADRKNLREAMLQHSEITARADTLEQLAQKAGLPEHGVRTSVEAWNRMVEVGTDFQFGRFGPNSQAANIAKIRVPPFYALRVYPLTRKSMGGPAIDLRGRVFDTTGQHIAGLYAAGELTGVAGINGSHGSAGTFLGPSVLLGRIAGENAATVTTTEEGQTYQPLRTSGRGTTRPVPDSGLPGYWHYDQVHQMASAQAYTCYRCHTSTSSMRSTDGVGEMLTRLNTCTGCH